MTTPIQYCQDKAVQSGSSFYYSFLFLPPARREAITALYAFCREVDDIADECTDPGVARAKLGWWREEVARLYAGAPQHPVTLALQPGVAAFDLPKECLDEIIAGMEMDCAIARYESFDTLAPYCHRVAGVVGDLSARIFGHTDPRTLDYAHALGMAFQLTNIIRDVGEDARRNRIYLPIDDLARFDVPASDLLNGRHTDNFERLMRFQAARARDYYKRAYALLPAADRRTQRPGLMMAAIYETLLDEIERERFQVLNQRISLTPLRKLWLAWKTWVFGR